MNNLSDGRAAAFLERCAEGRAAAFRELTRQEPELAQLEREIRALRDTGGGSFCAIEHWDRTFDSRLVLLAGWDAEKPGLQTSEAYNTAYGHLYSLLPDCRRSCRCRAIEAGTGLRRATRMTNELETQRTHDVPECLSIKDPLRLGPEERIYARAAHDALAWVLGLPCGRRFGAGLAQAAAQLKVAGIDFVDAGAVTARNPFERHAS
jgi:hypothetical protein